MSDFKGLEIHDIFGLSKPLEKLIEIVGYGVGKVYEPTHVRRMAKAKSSEIACIASTINDSMTSVVYMNGDVSINTTDADNLLKRAQARFMYQEMKKQQNIDDVVDAAYHELENVVNVSDEPLDEDWITSFFDFVANISSHQMQVVWGKLLAGEITQPGSFSIRTLDILRKLSQNEAMLFKKIIPLILKCPGDSSGTFFDYFILNGGTEEDDDILTKYGIIFPNILTLKESGLISGESILVIEFKIKPHEKEFIEGYDAIIEIENTSDEVLHVAHSAYVLTETGKELYQVVKTLTEECVPEWYMERCKSDIIGANLELSNQANVTIISKNELFV